MNVSNTAYQLCSIRCWWNRKEEEEWESDRVEWNGDVLLYFCLVGKQLKGSVSTTDLKKLSSTRSLSIHVFTVAVYGRYATTFSVRTFGIVCKSVIYTENGLVS